MRHIALLMEYPTLNGGERSTLAFCDQLSASHCRFTAIAPDCEPLRSELSHRAIDHYAFKFRDSENQRLPLPVLRTELALAIEALRPDVLHAVSLSTARIAGPVKTGNRSIRIGHLRDIMRLSPRAVRDINQLDLILAVSDAALQYHIDQGIDQTKSKRLYNGVDLTLFVPRPPTGNLHRQLGLPAAATIIACVGQIALRKGLDTALGSFRQIATEFPHSHLVIIGSRFSEKQETIRYEQSLHELAEVEELQGRVHFTGYLDSPQLFYPDIFCLLHCARQEPLGRVLLEAAACGTMVVASRVGGTPEIFPDETFAFLVEEHNEDEFARALRFLFENTADARRRAAAARRRIDQHFNIRDRALELASHYEA